MTPNDPLARLLAREQKLAEEIKAVWIIFRNASAGESNRARVWSETTRELWLTLPPSSAKRKATNRISQVLQTRQRSIRSQRALWQLLNDLLDIIEEAWRE